jgi:hypothetical protein
MALLDGNVGAAGGTTISDSPERRATSTAYAMVGLTRGGGGVAARSRQRSLRC